jgi:TonB-linked SusC/RagA family outer membrane protein
MKKFFKTEQWKMPACIILTCISFLCGQAIAFAQSPGAIMVKGTVYDAASRQTTLPGVSIKIKGTQQTGMTNNDGKFQIEVPSSQAILVFSYVGMQSKEIPVGTNTQIDVYLTGEANTLEDVVVTGYGTQKKSDVTGSVGVVSAKELLNAPVTNALQGLKGKVAGVNVTLNSGSPTGSPRVLIRGLGTINSSSNPLYVVDGVAMENIQVLNPNDIERMEVLKDASSTAIYGARGANGVILITTKRGNKTEGISIGYDGYVSIGVLPKKLEVLNSAEFLEVIKRGFANDVLYRPTAANHPVFSTSDPRLFDANGNPLYDTDWQEEATRTSVSHNNQISVLGKSEKSSFGAFMNYSNNEGIMLNSYLKRINGKISYDADPKKWLSLGFNMLVNNTTANETQEDGGGQSPRRSMLEMPPIFPVRWPEGGYSNSSQITDPYALETIANPVHVLNTQDRLRKRNQIFGNTYVTLHLIPGLDLRTQFGFDKRDNLFHNYDPTDLVNISAPLGFASIENQHSFYWQEETYLNYNKEVGDHRINAVLGLSWQERTYNDDYISAQGFSDNFFRYNSIQSASLPGAPRSAYDRWSMNSYFVRGSYSYKNRYLATFTGRADGSSRFGENKKYGLFPSVGLGWVVSQEPFFKGLTAIDEFKIRSSYGITGNTEIPTYQSLGTISSATTLINGTRVSSSFVNRLANDDLEWEKTKQFDVGFDLALLKRRITIGIDYYHKLTTDLLLDRPLPTSTGFLSVRDNIGSVSNRGIEVLLSGSPVKKDNFSWETTLNFSYNKNKIEKLGLNGEDIFPGPNFVSGSQTILRVGESLGSFWGYRRLGTWSTSEVAEAAAVGAIPGEAKRSTERTVIGKGMPDWTGSFINNFRYKQLDLGIDLQFVYGVEALQQFLHSTEDRTGYSNGFKSTLYESWTPQNQNTKIQQIRNGPYSGQNSEVDDQWAANGAYLRANAITLGYTIGQKTLDKLKIKNLRIYASVQNAFVVTSSEFKGYDPEATSYAEDQQWGQNIFFHQYPKPRTYTLGASLQF